MYSKDEKFILDGNDIKRQYPRTDSVETRRRSNTAYMKRNPYLLRKVTLLLGILRGYFSIPGEEILEFDMKTSLYIKFMPVLNVEDTKYSSLFRVCVQ